MKLAVLALIASLSAFQADAQARAACFRNCVSCRVRCKQRAPDAQVCIQTCLELKRACCQNCGHGPGPRTTCDCT